MSSPESGQDTRQQLSDRMLAALLNHVEGWIATLGMAGKPSNKKVSPQTRVAAAKTGIDLVVKLMSTSTSMEGEDLLRQLGELEVAADAEVPDDEDAEDVGDDDSETDDGPEPDSG